MGIFSSHTIGISIAIWRCDGVFFPIRRIGTIYGGHDRNTSPSLNEESIVTHSSRTWWDP